MQVAEDKETSVVDYVSWAGWLCQDEFLPSTG